MSNTRTMSGHRMSEYGNLLNNMELYHVLNRGVDKRKIFMDDKDRFRFVHDLFEFNDQNNAPLVGYNFSQSNYSDIGCPNNGNRVPRKLLVDIHAFAIMPNHYHLLISPRIANGIPLFMKKLNMGYAKYFNERYNRVGALFQGRYKSVHIERQAHFIHIPFYIHLNPLDMVAPEWRERKMKNITKAKDFLRKYRWSSYLDYTGKKNFPSVTSREFLSEVFHGQGGHEKEIFEWLESFEPTEYSGLLLE